MPYKSPGVYAEEISLFPPSVAEVATAIPAFIGYTEKAVKNGEDLTNKPTRITSLLEYRALFGAGYEYEAPPASGTPPITVGVNPDNNYAVTSTTISPRFYLYDSMRLFFDNGGGPCYVVSVGRYTTRTAGGTINAVTVQLGDPTNAAASPGLLVGLKALEKYDEPTIILFPDAVLLGSEDQMYTLQQQAIAQAARLQDRVAIFDLREGLVQTTAASFRDKIGINDLKYGAAYAPWLRTSYPRPVPFGSFRTMNGTATVPLETLSADPDLNALVVAASTAVADSTAIESKITPFRTETPAAPATPIVYQTLRDRYAKLRNAVNSASADAAAKTALIALIGWVHDLALDIPTWRTAIGGVGLAGDLKAYAIGKLRKPVESLIKLEKNASVRTLTGRANTTSVDTEYAPYNNTDWLSTQTLSTLTATTTDYGAGGLTVPKTAAAVAVDVDGIFKDIETFVASIVDSADSRAAMAESTLYGKHPVIANIVEEIRRVLSAVPPTGAVAGVYAYVDGTRGVWKAPANVSLASVVGPVEAIDNSIQDDLNVDVNAGKSINAIRAFTGRGTIVWGARTLAGNDNEWRYIPVRRFYNMVEESVRKSTAWAVFEPNAAPLWTKVKSMIDNYLLVKWRDGALAGATPDDAFFVKVGLGQTMTAQDILEGFLIVEIGMAVVRPAEFIILRFSHKMQKS